MDLLIAINPEAVLFLGKCGGLKKRNEIGDLILPIGAIRGDGTSDDYFAPEVPAMPSFALQKVISRTLRENKLSTSRLRHASQIIAKQISRTETSRETLCGDENCALEDNSGAAEAVVDHDELL